MLNHRANVPVDDGGPIVFKWHWPRGTFSKRMSGHELASFIMPHMSSILPYLSGNKRIYAEFEAMLVKIATSSIEALDQVLPWIKPVIRTEDDDIIEMSIGAKHIDEGVRFYT